MRAWGLVAIGWIAIGAGCEKSNIETPDAGPIAPDAGPIADAGTPDAGPILAPLTHFTGPAWTISGSVTLNCNGAMSNDPLAPQQHSYTSSAPNEVEYTNGAGCLYQFSVSSDGNTGTLSNGPVVCTQVSGGQSAQLTTTAYTITSTDGSNLSLEYIGTVINNGTSCGVTGNATGTR